MMARGDRRAAADIPQGQSSPRSLFVNERGVVKKMK